MKEQLSRSIYDFPDIYDRVLRASDEQIQTEINSIRRLLAERGLTQGRVLELACGTCAHGILLAKHGFSVTGIDISPPMLEGAKHRAESAGVEIALFHGDVIDFDLNTELFDGAIFMAETLPLITDYEEIERHFRAVRRHLRKGGLYVIDVDAHQHGVGTTYQVWGQKKVLLDDGWVEVWHEDIPGDWVRGTSHVVMHCRIHVDDSVYETVDDWHIRVDSPWHLAVLVRALEDSSLTGFFSWRNLRRDITDEEHYFMVVE